MTDAGRKPCRKRYWIVLGLFVFSIAGYAGLFLALRTFDPCLLPNGDSVGYIEFLYPNAIRLYITNDEAAEGYNVFPDGFSPALGRRGDPLINEYTSHGVYKAIGGARGWWPRLFYPLERVELWLRGITPNTNLHPQPLNPILTPEEASAAPTKNDADALESIHKNGTIKRGD